MFLFAAPSPLRAASLQLGNSNQTGATVLAEGTGALSFACLDSAEWAGECARQLDNQSVARVSPSLFSYEAGMMVLQQHQHRVGVTCE